MTILTNRLSVLSELGISASAGSSLGSLGNISDIYSPSLSISDSINNTTNLLTEISFVSSSEIILIDITKLIETFFYSLSFSTDFVLTEIIKEFLSLYSNTSCYINNKIIYLNQLILTISKGLSLNLKTIINDLIENSVLSYNITTETLRLNKNISINTTTNIQNSIKTIIAENIYHIINKYINNQIITVQQELNNIDFNLSCSQDMARQLEDNLFFSVLEILRQKKYYNHIAEIVDLVSQKIEFSNINDDGVCYSIKDSERVSLPNILNENISIHYPTTSILTPSIINEEIIC